jgi:hypothetical protein
VWGSSSELILGSILLYTWRLFERQFGSRKFGGCVAFLLVGSTLLQCGVLAFSRGVVSSGGRDWLFSSGPYGLVFGLLAIFFWDIPQSAPFTVFGVPLSDKLFIYLLGLQLALSAVPGSAYTALIGLVLGVLYRWELMPFHRLRVPQWLSTACGTVFSPVLSGSIFAQLAGVQDNRGRRVGGSGRVGGGPAQAAARAAAAAGAAAPTHAGGYSMVGDDAGAGALAEPEGEILNDGFYAVAPPPPSVAVDPSALAQLTSMGFSEDRARTALQATQNNLTAATNRLLGL